MSHVEPPDGWEFESNPSAHMPEGWVGIRQTGTLSPLVLRLNLFDPEMRAAMLALVDKRDEYWERHDHHDHHVSSHHRHCSCSCTCHSPEERCRANG